MVARVSVFIATAAVLVSCASPAPINRQAEAARSEPAITGRSEFISSSELHIALGYARGKLATLAPWSPIFRVVVIAPKRIEAYYCIDYDRDRVDVFYQNHPGTGYLLLERTAGEWRILPGREPKVLNDDRYLIIT